MPRRATLCRVSASKQSLPQLSPRMGGGDGSASNARAAELGTRDNHVMGLGRDNAQRIHAVPVATGVPHQRVVAVLEVIVAPPATGAVQLSRDDRDVAHWCCLASRYGELASTWPCVSAFRVAHGYDGRRETRQLRCDAPAVTWPSNEGTPHDAVGQSKGGCREGSCCR